MLKNKRSLILLTIVGIGFLLRVINLGENPPGLTWDEASLGYNAYSILKTGADEYGNTLPLDIRSFNDYKPPVYVYFSIPFIAGFGLNEFSVRLLSALSGTLLIVVVYFLVRELLKDKEMRYASLVSAGLVALSPWSIQHSRAAFEGNVGLLFLLTGILFLVKGLKQPRFFIYSTIPFIVSLYAYHSFRVAVPAFIGVFVLMYWKIFKRNLKYALISLLLLTIAVVPILQGMLMSEGAGSRLLMVSQFAGHDLLEPSIKRLEYARENGDFLGMVVNNRRVVYAQAFVDGYFDHFDPGFLFVHGDSGRHHHALDMGVLYLWELPFIALGAAFLLMNVTRKKVLIILLLLIAPIPSAVATGSPHAVRAIAMMPAFHVLTAFGVVWVLYQLKRKKLWISVLAVLFFVNVSYYFYQYFVQTPVVYADFWQAGNRELYEMLEKREDSYDRIIVTYYYDQPHAYYLFFNQIDPEWYQEYWKNEGEEFASRFEKRIGKYEFRKIDWGRDMDFPNTLIVAAPDEVPEDILPIESILLPDQTDMYVFIETK